MKPFEKASRRNFLESVVVAPLALRLGSRLGSLGVLLPAGRQVQQAEGGGVPFEYPDIIRYDAHCFTINNRDTFLMSGCFHYCRCPRALWRDRLLKFRRAGFNTIESYVFWNYHEPVEGKADLSEFEGFVKLLKEMGLWMVVRPGPYVCAEWDAGGFPHWVIAQRFPLRSDDPRSIKSSQHWYDQVLPVIRRYQVTQDGPIIMMQVENEYDYWDLPIDHKRAYLSALANMAWNGGINIPLITCWTKPARQNQYPDMMRIADFCNFYPRWNIAKEVPLKLQELRKEEPYSPVGVTELQGGWFSQFGGKLSVDQEGVNGAQLNMITKTVIEQGGTFFSYYMGLGGTNFDWAAKNLTTSYDYAAPIREPGGLWEKYYAARGIGASLALFGGVIARSSAATGVQSTNPSVTVTALSNGQGGTVLVRENSNAEQHYKMTFPDPASPTHRPINIPRQGELTLGAREMKMLPVQIPIPGSQICYSTAEVLAAGLNSDRHWVILYDQPGRDVELSLATQKEPQIEGGDLTYRYWDEDYQSMVLGYKVGETEKPFLVNDHLVVWTLPRDRALHTWTAVFPAKLVPEPRAYDEAEKPKPIDVAFVSDAALLADSGSKGNKAWVDLDFAPGQHDLMAIIPATPTKCRIDGEEIDFKYDRPWRSMRLDVTAPALPLRPMSLNQVETWVEKFDPAVGEWTQTPARALEEIGAIPYNYVKYKARFEYSGQAKMFVSLFDDDQIKVFVNGKPVAEAAIERRQRRQPPEKQTEFPLAAYAQQGANTIEVSYELFGSYNGGATMANLKGIERVSYGADAQSGTVIDAWQVQRFPAAMRGREIDLDYAAGGWTKTQLGDINPSAPLVPSYTWCRTAFSLDKLDDAWQIPIKVTFEADRDALLYLNGKFVGRYMTIGPQKDFYLPDPYLVYGKGTNSLTVVLAYSDSPNHIKTLRVGPYEEFSTRRTRIEFEWEA